MYEEKQYIKVPKELFFSDYHEDKELFHFVMTLLSLTRYSPITVDDITVGPGQILTTGPYLCKRCSITRGKLRGFLKYLAATGFISYESIGRKYTLITVHKKTEFPKMMNGIKLSTTC